MTVETHTRARSSLNRGPQFAAPRAPKVPETLAQTGLTAETVSELILKTLYVQGARTGKALTDSVRLPFGLLDERLLDLQQRQLVHVLGAGGHGRGGYTFELTTKGRERAREAMDSSQYVGPAPVPLAHYRAWVEAGSIKSARVTREAIEAGFSHLVLSRDFLEQLGPAINSAKSMFLYGDSGNGKTTIAEAIARMMGGDLYMPYAVEIEGTVMVIHDPIYHRELEESQSQSRDANGGDPDWLRRPDRYDRRFARVARPVVFAGGELTLEDLDLKYDPHTKIYQAPFQVKANGGVLIIDDLGRQIVRPRDLLNRWIVPLEKRMDFLTLHTGHKFPVPFDCLLIFATNLDPLELVDEAFLRRIHYKILVDDPTRDEYVQIFRRGCIARQIPFRREAVDHVYDRFYERCGIAARSCHPRDILDHLCDAARFLDVEPALDQGLLDRACRSYFLDLPGDAASLGGVPIGVPSAMSRGAGAYGGGPEATPAESPAEPAPGPEPRLRAEASPADGSPGADVATPDPEAPDPEVP